MSELIKKELLKSGQAKVGFSDVPELVNVSKSTGLDKIETHEDRQREQDANLVASGKDSVLFKPFDNQTGIAKFGHGSLASMFGVDVHDLKGNVVGTETHDPTDRKNNETDTREQVELPLLRYINLPGGSIELRMYRSGKITASKNLDNKWVIVIDKGTALEVLEALAERAHKPIGKHYGSTSQVEEQELGRDLLGSGVAESISKREARAKANDAAEAFAVGIGKTTFEKERHEDYNQSLVIKEYTHRVELGKTTSVESSTDETQVKKEDK